MNKIAQEILKLASSSSDGVFSVIKLSEETVFLESNGTRVEIDISSKEKEFEHSEARTQLGESGYITAIDTKPGSYQLTAEGYKAAKARLDNARY